MEIDKSLEAGFARALERDPHDAGTLGMWSDFKEQLGELEAANRLRVHALLGKNYLGPEAWALLGSPITGEVARLPAEAAVPAFWEQPCPIMRDGRTVAQTHRLAYIPGDISLLKLWEVATGARVRLGRPPIFFRDDRGRWYEGEDFATRPYCDLAAAAGLGTVERGRWVLLPERDLPKSRDKTYTAQEAELAKYPDYRTALCVELVTALVLDDVQNRPTVAQGHNTRLFRDVWGRCTDTFTESGFCFRICAGHFSAHGLGVARNHDDFRDKDLGLALIRLLSEAS